jgi:DNA-binding NarL/FixJ family response regulator
MLSVTAPIKKHPRPIRILCVDDHPLVRDGIARKIDRESDMEVVGTASTGEEAIELFRRHRPDIVLMDLQLPGMSGTQAIHEIRQIDPEARIVVLTVYSGDEDIYRAIQAGAASYLLKDTLANDLVAIVRQVSRGERPIPTAVADRLASRVGQAGLSTREIEVLELIATGKRNKEIADALGITQETVQTHIKRLFQKLHVNDRTAAVTVALSRGIVHIK